mgnify:CR=1 FL=1
MSERSRRPPAALPWRRRQEEEEEEEEEEADQTPAPSRRRPRLTGQQAAGLKRRARNLARKRDEVDSERERVRLQVEINAIVDELERAGYDFDPDEAGPAAGGANEEQPAWQPPTVETFDWSLLKDKNPFQEEQNAKKKKERRRLETERLRDEGRSKREIAALFKHRDTQQKRGRPALQINNEVWNDWLKKEIIDKDLYFGPQRLWDHIQSLPAKPDGLSFRYLSRWRQAVETFFSHGRWVEDKDVLRRVPKSGESLKFKQWQCDLKGMRESNGFNYILTVTNIISKAIWVRPIKKKDQADTTAAMKSVLEATPANRRPDLLICDGGLEFKGPFSQLLTDYGIRQTINPPGRPQAAGGVERANATVARLSSMHERQTGKLDWPVWIQTLTAKYNASRSFVTGFKPNDVENWLASPAQHADRLQEIADSIRQAAGVDDPGLAANRGAEPKFAVGDIVVARAGQGAGLLKNRGLQWSTEPLKITYREAGKNNGVVRYQVVDKFNEPVKESQGDWFTNDQLKLYVPPLVKSEQEKTFIIRSILAPAVYQRDQQREPGYRVSWVGYPRKDITVEPRRILMEDVPSMVTRFDAENNVRWAGNTFTWTKKKKQPLPRTQGALERFQAAEDQEDNN